MNLMITIVMDMMMISTPIVMIMINKMIIGYMYLKEYAIWEQNC